MRPHSRRVRTRRGLTVSRDTLVTNGIPKDIDQHRTRLKDESVHAAYLFGFFPAPLNMGLSDYAQQNRWRHLREAIEQLLRNGYDHVFA